MRICIIGGGVIGLSCAYYLAKEGHEITILDSGTGVNNCSIGNAGYISPSHFIPLASPGIVAQGLKWMLSSTSPFYIKPRLNTDLVKWGIKFFKSANEKTLHKNAIHLNNILRLSRDLMVDLDQQLGGGFALRQDGCLMLCKTESTFHHEKEVAKEANHFNIETSVLSREEVQNMEPEVHMDILGGVYFPIDCHVHPVKMMERLYAHAKGNGIHVLFEQEVRSFEKKDGVISGVITDKTKIDTDHLIVATGAWLPVLLQKLGVHLLLQAGKGYSTTYQNLKNNLHYPAILVDDRVAMTPLGRDLRVGGTMELSGINHHINMNRVKPIITAANSYYTNIGLEMPVLSEVWAGLRPVSPDGLPYIGRHTAYKNLVIAGGHAMLGISLAAATGLLVKQIVQKEKTEIDIQAFNVER